MDGVRTRGHPGALAALTAMVAGPTPHAILLVGPAGVGKTTFAVDLAGGLLCTADVPDRPCGRCRACRLVGAGGHPDVHRLGPEGPGRQVVIGGPGAKARGIRDLIAELALLPVEGGARIAIIEAADRMNDDAQAALLKTLEEPPAGVTIVLCADAEEALLPTIRSRCARIRLGPVGPRAVETVLADHGIDDPALAARLARVSAGRPGRALALAADPEALRARDELVRTLLDLLDARPAERLAGIRSATGAAATIARILDPDAAPAAAAAQPVRPPRGRGRGTPAAGPADRAVASEAPADGQDVTGGDADAAELEEVAPARASAVQRRRAAEALVAVWTDVARDLALAARGLDGALRDVRLLEETRAAAAGVDPAIWTAFLDRLGRASVLLSANVAPDLVLDDLTLAWPTRRADAA